MPLYRAFTRRWYEAERRKDIRFGTVLGHYFAANSSNSARHPQPGEWYGHILPAKEQTDDDMLAQMRAFSEQWNKQLEKDKGS